MLLLTDIRENKDRIIAGLKKRNIPAVEQIIEAVIQTDADRRTTQGELDKVLADSNLAAKQIGQLMKDGKREEAEQAKIQTQELKKQSRELSDKLGNLEQQLKEQLYNIPNVPNSNVPEGSKAEDNITVFEAGTMPVLPAGSLPHWDLIVKYDIIDFELGNKITGAGFPVYKGKGARLQRAMINFFLDEALKAGFTEIQPPIFINEESGLGTGQLPDKEGQMYKMNADNLYAIPTAEVPVTNIYRDVILRPEEIPIRNVAYTPCFRREAGAWGANVRGLNRLHQFDKVEIVQITYAENSYKVLDEMLDHVKGLLLKLELPFRMLNLCGGDLGFTSAQTFDMEVYSAAQEKWLEVSSISNFETYQANRLKVRYKDKEGKTQLLHTLNGSALALPRVLAALLENNQTEKGIVIPKVLQPYCGFDMID